MAAPTPLSAYTDGLAWAWHALGWAAGALTLLLVLWVAVFLMVVAGQPLARATRLRWLSWRLHREHARSGRG